MKKNEVLLIGCGNIGFRHLEGLLKVPVISTIHIFDINFTHLKSQKSSLEKNLNKIKTYNSIFDLPKFVDFVIFATGATERFNILVKILSITKTHNIFLEKIPFNKINEIDLTSELLYKNTIKAWVNCPRRIIPVYVQIMNFLKDESCLNAHVQGANWGMACNAFHFLDLFQFLAKSPIQKLTLSPESAPFTSKRKGYFEILGRITAVYNNKSEVVIDCTAIGNPKIEINIESPTIQKNELVVYEGDKKLINRNSTSVIEFPFASELTRQTINSFFLNQEINLPSFNEVISLNRLYINTFLDAFKNNIEINNDRCPIT